MPDCSDELDLLRAVVALDREADDALEHAIRHRRTLAATVSEMLPILAKHADAQAVWLRTWDEDLELCDFAWPESADPGFDVEAVYRHCQLREPYGKESGERGVIGQHLDVAGEFFGVAAVRFAGVGDEHRLILARRLLEVWCEALDNTLAAVVNARRKHQVTRAVSRALQNPLLDDGITEAIAALGKEVRVDDMLLVYRHEDDADSLDYRILIGGEMRHCSLPEAGLEVDEDTRRRMLKMLLGEDPGLPGEFGINGYREEVLINGIREQQVVGRLITSRRGSEFNTFDRDLLERFADHLRQRIVDFNREWKLLSQCFPCTTVLRLLREVDYVERFLTPREREVAVLFCDLSGFTRVSEQVLGEPALIGELIDTWSKRVVEIIWEHGGVYDKMVGDCVIGLWGPPFFDWSEAETCHRAVEAAIRIREFTRALPSSMSRLQNMDFPFGVATGLNYCPLFVGRFGPDEDFTGFSSGMNNTARLQGIAKCHDILCMDRLVAALARPERFGEELHAQAKNVANPLGYHALLD